MVLPSPKLRVPQSRVQISGSLDVGQALQRADQVGAGPNSIGFRPGRFQVAAHAGGEVDDDVHVGFADALHHFAVQRHVAAERPVCGSRTWQWTTVAPALAASTAASAICLG
jgi:hypothetical protein